MAVLTRSTPEEIKAHSMAARKLAAEVNESTKRSMEIYHQYVEAQVKLQEQKRKQQGFWRYYFSN